MNDIQLTPPSNIDAEVSVIGSMLIDNSLIDSVSEVLTREDFYSTANQNIFGVILDVYNNGSAVDLVILKNELSRLFSFREKWWCYILNGHRRCCSYYCKCWSLC